MDWHDRIAVDPAVCHGKACIRGTRAQVAVVLDNLAEGLSVEQIVADYPSLTPDDVQAVLAYAADLAGERSRTSPLPPPDPKLDGTQKRGFGVCKRGPGAV